MSTYSQLKLQNDELVQKQNQLHLGTICHYLRRLLHRFMFLLLRRTIIG